MGKNSHAFLGVGGGGIIRRERAFVVLQLRPGTRTRERAGRMSRGRRQRSSVSDHAGPWPLATESFVPASR